MNEQIIGQVFIDDLLDEILINYSAYDIDAVFASIRDYIANKKIYGVDDIQVEYRSKMLPFIKMNVLYRYRSAPSFVPDEDWEELENKYPDDFKEDVIQIDDDEYFTESDYGTHWSQFTTIKIAPIMLFYKNFSWMLRFHNVFKKQTQYYHTLKEAVDFLNEFPGESLDDNEFDETDVEAWRKEIVKMAEKYGKEKISEPYDDSRQLELPFD